MTDFEVYLAKTMRPHEFKIGKSFWYDETEYECTDLGSRCVLGIKLADMDTVVSQLGEATPETIVRLTRAEAEKHRGFKGPPFAVVEHVFDETDLPACSFDKEGNGTNSGLGTGKPMRREEWLEWISMRRKKRMESNE
jgi:hypothetical protein